MATVASPQDALTERVRLDGLDPARRYSVRVRDEVGAARWLGGITPGWLGKEAVEMVVRAYKLRIARAEFPTSEVGRAYGTTHFKIWPTGKRLLKYLKFEFFRRD